MRRKVLLGLTVAANCVLLALAGCTGSLDQPKQRAAPAASQDAAAAETPSGEAHQSVQPAASTPSVAPAAASESVSRAGTTLVPPTTPADGRATRPPAIELCFADVVAKARPAVVGIAVRAQLIDQFFRVVSPIQSGSGVIIDPRGYILTNEHVVANATRIEVTTDDEQTYVAEIVGKDATIDLAVIKIAAPQPLRALVFAVPDSYRVGDWVVAIGNALGLAGGPTVTVGVIGALERSISVEADVLSDLVQTDAAINEGNSGGPLLNLNAEIVGINTIGAREGGGQGIGFAVSSFTAAPVARVLMEQGRVPWAWMGASVDELSPSRAMDLGLRVRKGVIIVRISRSGPAFQAGLRAGDVLLQVDDTPLQRVRDLNALLRERFKAGQSATVAYMRGSDEGTAKVTFTEAPQR
ncbi:MAG: trypsin-like serine protease [Dehalococcoidia bacterium]|nr:trypsin-like serine protease [Dehalococcoidia bacterium]